MIDDLLKALMGDATPDSEDERAGGDPLAGLLGGLMGGEASDSAAGAGDLLGALLGGSGMGAQGGLGVTPGGTTAGEAGGMGGLLSALLGGGAAPASAAQAPAVGAGSFLGPVIEGITGKLGLPPQIAQMVVTFVLGKLLGGLVGGATPAPAAQEPAPSAPGGLDLGQVLGQMGSGQGLEPAMFRTSGIAEELAEQTGLDSDTAAASIQETLSLLGAQLGGSQQPD